MRKTIRLAWATLAVMAGFTVLTLVTPQAEKKAEAQAGKTEAATITLTRVPPPTVKPGPDQMDTIAGKVRGVDFQQYKVVIYAYGGDMWYVQPYTASPLTDIDKDGKWENDTHGGFEYAALLVKSPPFKPRPTVANLPEIEDDVLAIVREKPGAPVKPVTTISFCNYEWTVKSSDNRVGPGPNYFSDSTENVSVDEDGRLHLRITKRDKEWYCAEVISKESFGYGTYRFYLDSAVDSLDPQVVLGLFTWSDESAHSNREIDIELSKWANANSKTTAQFVVQPYSARNHLQRFDLPAGMDATTYSFTWKSDSVSFSGLKGHEVAAPDADSVIKEWTFDSKGVPPAGGENARINLWLMGGRPPKQGKETEIVISKFEFVPVQ